MEAQGFVSKNQRLEKVHRESLLMDIPNAGNMVRRFAPCDPLPPLVRHFIALRGGLYRPINAVLHCFVACS